MDRFAIGQAWRGVRMAHDAIRELAASHPTSPGFIPIAAAIAKAIGADEDEREAIVNARWPTGADRILRAAAAHTVADLPSAEQIAWFGSAIESSLLDRFIKLPSNTPLLTLDGIVASFVAEGAAIPLPSSTITEPTFLRLRKIQGLFVASNQFLKTAGSESVVESSLQSATAVGIDTALLDSTNDGSAAAPAAITYYGQLEIPSAGADAAAVRADFEALFAAFAGDFCRAVLAMHPTTAAQIGLMQAPLGQSDLRLDGTGFLFGIPVHITRGAVYDSSGSTITLIDTSAIGYASGAFRIETSRQTTLQMLAATSASAPDSAVTETAQVSLFHANCTAFKSVAEVDWSLQGGDNRVVSIINADYTGATTP